MYGIAFTPLLHASQHLHQLGSQTKRVYKHMNKSGITGRKGVLLQTSYGDGVA